jgi:PKD repeat protein
VTFDASGATDDSGIVGYEWDFDGDGTVDATGQQATHSYDNPGVYTVKLTITDDDGATASNDTTVSVSEANAAPSPAFMISPSDPTTEATVSFDASETTDDSGISEYEWDFDGDGTVETTGEQVTYRYEETGTYTVRLTVTDTDGETAVASQPITIVEANQPPTATFTVNTSSPTTETIVSFDASSAQDDGGITRYQWDFDGDGTVEATGGQPTHQYDTPGSYTVELTVRDADGATDTTTRSITVSEPEKSDQSSERSGGEAFTYKPSSPTVDTTVRFDANEFPSDATATSYEWDFTGDGTADAFGSTVPHIFSSGGTQTVALTAELESGETETVRRTVLVNTPPEPGFSISPSPAIIEEPTTFDAGETTDSTGSIESYKWDFNGDGMVDKTEKAVTHTFSEEGRPTVTLQVTDTQGVTATESRSILVQRAATFSVQLRDTTITPDGKTTAAITVNNLLGSDRLLTQLELNLPSGWDVTFVDAGSAGGGTATEIFETQAGQTRTIRVQITPNDTGEFSVGGRAFYYIGDQSPPRHTRQLSSGTLTVTDGETTNESTASPTDQPPATATGETTQTGTETSTGMPGLGVGAGVTALGGGVGLLRALGLLEDTDDSDESDTQ